MSKVYYRFSIENKGFSLENLNRIMDEAEGVAEAAQEFQVVEIDPLDYLMKLSQFLEKRYCTINTLAEADEIDKANHTMLETYRVIAIAGIRIGANLRE